MLPLQYLHFGEQVAEVLRMLTRASATLHPLRFRHGDARAGSVGGLEAVGPERHRPLLCYSSL